MTNKVDASNTEVFRYQYDANGKLTNRWSNAKGGINTHYAYDVLGNLTNTTHPNSPAISFAYDVLNRRTNMVDAVGTTRYTYGTNGLLSAEDGPWSNDTVSYTYQTNKLRQGLSLDQPAGPWSLTYAYDAANRLKTIISAAGAFDYAYPSGTGNQPATSPVFTSITFPSGSFVNRSFDHLARLTNTVLKDFLSNILDSHSYAYNLLQRTQVVHFAQSLYTNRVDYTYDNLQQLKTAVGRELDGTLRLQEQFSYGYDSAGNLTNRVKNQLTNTFAINNAKNQLDSITPGGTVTVAGTTTPAATAVTVNGQTASLYADKTFVKDGLSLQTSTITAIASDGQGNSATNSINVNLGTGVTCQYDANGSMLSDGKRLFTYDDEDQLIGVIITNGVNNSTQTGFVYDGLKRRRIRSEATWQGSAWVTNQVVRYIYDGNLVIQERDGNNEPQVTYTRGIDLGGSLEGAGGIGGLLCRTHPGSHHFFYHADAGGNIMAVLNEAQVLVAQYQYDPYGNLLSMRGALAETNLYRFSSKEFHPALGLYYYGQRFYEPSLQRWLNHDPSDIVDGPNLNAFVHNDPLNATDPDGQFTLIELLGVVNIVGVLEGMMLPTITKVSKPVTLKKATIVILTDFEVSDATKKLVAKFFDDAKSTGNAKPNAKISFSFFTTQSTKPDKLGLDPVDKNNVVFRTWLNAAPGLQAAERQYADDRNAFQINPDLNAFQMAAAIAHAVGFHAIGGFDDPTPLKPWTLADMKAREGHIDDTNFALTFKPDPNNPIPTFSEATAMRIMKVLGFR